MPRASAPRFHPGVRVETRTLPRAGGKRYAILWLGSEPVNSMTLELWTALSENLTALESDPNVSGVVFASELKKPIFTAGNDINELYAPKTSRERYAQFWRVQTSFLCHLLRSPLATVCAIRGACPAGVRGVPLLRLPRPIRDGHLRTQRGTARHPRAEILGQTLRLHRRGRPQRGTRLAPRDAVDPHRGARPGAHQRDMPPRRPRRRRGARDGDAAETSGRREGGDEAQHTGDFSREWEAFIEEEARDGWGMLCRDEVAGALGAVIDKLSSRNKRTGGGERGKVEAVARL